MSNISNWPADRDLSGTTILSQSGPGTVGNEGLLHISQSSRITEASSSDCLVLYPRHSLRESYSSAEMQSVYSTALANFIVLTIIREYYILKNLNSTNGKEVTL